MKKIPLRFLSSFLLILFFVRDSISSSVFRLRNGDGRRSWHAHSPRAIAQLTPDGASGRAIALQMHDAYRSSLTTSNGDTPSHLDPNAIDTCPPPPSKMPRYLCNAPTCRSDGECSPRELRRCCYNGCKFTCMMKMLPPPLVDWSEAPNMKSGGWLLNDKEDNPVETCTTSHFDSSDWTQPLLCPHGYTCHILDLGDPTNGVPNRGHCVKESHTHKTHAHGPVWHFRIRTGSTSNLGCTLDSQVYSNGAFFQYDRHPCTCEQGMITCAVARYRNNSNSGSSGDQQNA